MWTVHASDVEWVECEHINKTGTIIQLEALRCTLDSLPETNGTVTHQKVQSYLESLTSTLSADANDHKFNLEPESFSTKVSVKKYDTSTTNIDFQSKMKQIPANNNNATTGHKLQGMSKDVIIVASWPTASMFRNWEYVVLSSVQTLSGLYLVEPIDIDKSFEPSDKLKKNPWDAGVMVGTNYIDPALCIYVGAHLICIDNKHLKDKVPRGNGSICRVIGIKVKEQPQSYNWKNYYGKCGQ
jgi:hypothetical protein